VLGLDVPDLDLPQPARQGPPQGGQLDMIVWQTGTARLLLRLLKGRTGGPVFLTDRRARWNCPRRRSTRPAAGPGCPTAKAEDLFKAATGGATLHQLRTPP